MPTDLSPRTRSLLVAIPLALSLAACGGKDGGSGEMNATPGDVDPETSATATEAEQQAFQPPADSVITPAQVEKYLKTTLLQFDLVRKEAVGLHETAREMKERAKDGGLVAGLRNAAAGMSLVGGWADVVGGSYVRSARTLGYNPAEMEWVRERMSEVGGYMAMKPMYEQAQQGAGAMAGQIAEMRRQLDAGQLAGYTREQLDSMEAQTLRSAAEVQAQNGASRAVLANVEVLRRARPAVTDTMWTVVGWTGGATGLLALTGLTDPEDTEAQRKLDEVRALYQAVLANRPFQAGQAAGDGAAPRK
jgi:hypothetical protein